MFRSAQRKISTSVKTNAKLGLAVEKAHPLMEGLEGRQLMSTTTFVSDLTPTSATNGWGSYEKDMSNGEQAKGDGQTLNIAGTKYAKGLGTNASSTLTYNLNGQYDQFLSAVGVDNEVGKRGSVVFQAYLDGVKVYDSGKMVGGQAAKNVSLTTTGKKQLKLVVTDAGDGNAYDHGDWGNARLVANGTTPTTPTDPTSPSTGSTPAAPTGLTATAYNTAQVNLSWADNSTNETGFKIERSTDGKTFTQVGTVGANVTSYQSTGLTKGTKYYYRVRATNASGDSAYTAVANASTPTADTPIAPTNLTATAASASQVNLSWKDNSNIETGYKIERSTDGTNFTQVGTVGANVTSFQNTGLTAGTQYTYRVRATNAAGDSAYTNTASATTTSTPTGSTPAAPTGLTATAYNTAQVNLSWADNSTNETGFKIERSTDGTNFTQVATTGANVTTFQDTGLTAGTKYTYRVRATNASGDSAYTAVANASTPTADTPIAPTSLTAAAASASAINLAWKDNSNIETGYKIERSTDGTNFTQVGLTGANVTTFQDKGLTAGTKYTYRVRATNAAGDSAYTNTASATTSTSSSGGGTTTPPSTGVKPDATNTGPTNASILKSSGSINVTQNGAVIQDVNVNGNITVNASNVTIKNFKINANGASYGITIGANCTNVTIEDGEIIGSSGAGIYGPNFTARRLNIHEAGGDGIKPWSNVVIDSCYIHNLGMNPGDHADGIQESGGDNITITNNNIDMPEYSSGGKTYLSNSAIFLSGAFGPINNVKIDHNWLNGGNYTIYSVDPNLGTGAPTNVSITNNVFGRSYNYGIRDTQGSVVWSGNTWADTGATA